jgi:ribonuclease E
VTQQNLPGENAGAIDAEKTPRRTRARRPAAAPAEAAAPTTTPDAAVPDAAVPDVAAPDAAGSGDTPAPARTRARRSATRATSAPGNELPSDPPQPTEDAAPVAPTRSRRRAAAKTQAVVPDAEAPVVGSAAEAVAELISEPEAAPETSVRVGGTSRLATTAVLFQAPDPTVRPRRRRAEAPAGPPRHADDVEPADAALLEEEEQPTDAPPDELEPSPLPVQDAEGEDEGEDGGARRRRRRGGRGRRGRSGERADDQHDEQRDQHVQHDQHGDQTEDERSGETEVDETAPRTTGQARGSGRAAAGSARNRRGGRAAATDLEPATDSEESEVEDEGETEGEGTSSSSRRRRRRRRSRGEGPVDETPPAEPRAARQRARTDEVTALKGSTRLEAKRQRRREGRDAGRRRTVITEAEFLARRESVERTMVVRETDGRVQIGVVEDGVLVEHYVSRSAQNSGAPMAGNVYLGRVQNVLPSMEAAFVDIGKGRNAVLYAGEVNWDAAGLEGQPRRIEQAMKSGDPVLVQVTKEPVGHKGARLTSQITLAGRYLVYVPGGGMTGISRKLPDNERTRLKKILKEIVPDDAGVIVRTAAEGASDEELRQDVQRLQDQWTAIEKKSTTAAAPALLQGEPDLAIRVVRDVFNDDFSSLVVQGEDAWSTVSDYVAAMAPDLATKVTRWTEPRDVFAAHRIDEQLAKGMDRKVWLPSGGSLVIDRTEAMTVIDVNTGKFTGSGGTLEETVTRNNLEAAEEIVRQLRLRDIGGIIVIDFIDMVLESNRDLVLRRLIECLGRDRTKHQVAEVTSLGLVQMTRKRVGQGLLEAFSEPCPQCSGRGFLIHSEPVDSAPGEAPAASASENEPKRSRRKKSPTTSVVPVVPVLPEAREAVKATLATIAAAAAHAHEHKDEIAHDVGAPAVLDESPEGDAEGSVVGEVVEVPASSGLFEWVETDVEEPVGVDSPDDGPDDRPDDSSDDGPDHGPDDGPDDSEHV